MGCLSSRSTIAPSSSSDSSKGTNKGATKSKRPKLENGTEEQTKVMNGGGDTRQAGFKSDGITDRTTVATSRLETNTNHTNITKGGTDKNPRLLNHLQHSIGSSTDVADDDIMSILMGNQENYKQGMKDTKQNDKDPSIPMNNINNNNSSDIENGGKNINNTGDERVSLDGIVVEGKEKVQLGEQNEMAADTARGAKQEASVQQATSEADQEEQNMELLRQYVAVDYEIAHLEDKDALRVYHEKIEQLEQLEHELDMISGEAEKVAVRSEAEEDQLERQQSISVTDSRTTSQRRDLENNSIKSGTTNSRSWLGSTTNSINIKEERSSIDQQPNKKQTVANENKRDQTIKSDGSAVTMIRNSDSNGDKNGRRNIASGSSMTGLPYSTVEEVFNRKIILEKERDRLKKEVEFVIVECDKLQQRYKKRDEILDKIFDGRTGNGLENHLEQQLDWLLEQKHYVDQVFYSWKRAETLTSQTCEQFSSALEQLKSLPKLEEPNKRAELAKSIANLLIKSRQDMEQAQKYNPNVDAPFFTDNETERFDKIIETISMNPISPSDYSQILTVIQFAYKRAVSIRLWLEQILQTTIARDSFELAEEYKWIAIQLRKERINLIKSKLQEPKYQPMVQTVQEQMKRRQQSHERRQQHEINRDSGVESETNDIDIEEEIYRLLELNKSRLEAATTSAKNRQQRPLQVSSQQQPMKTSNQRQAINSEATHDGAGTYNKDEVLRHRVQRRVEGDLPLHLSKVPIHGAAPGGAQVKQVGSNRNSAHGSELSINNSSLASSATPTKLKIELDEEARQCLLKQVDQIHSRHRSRMERLRGSNRAKATTSILNRMLQARQQQQQQQQPDQLNGSAQTYELEQEKAGESENAAAKKTETSDDSHQ